MKDFAERLGVSERTVARLEKGDGGVRIETLAMACLVLGELDRISGFLDAGSDDIGLLLEKERLPKRIRSKASARPIDHDSGQSGNDGGNGSVGF